MTGCRFERVGGGVLVAAVLLLGVACVGESDRAVRAKLDVILRDDLRSVVEELPAGSVADSARFDVLEFRRFDEGAYSHKAVAEFHFLRNEIAVMTRKYRYDRERKLWDRYFNQYRLVHDSTKS